MQYGMTYIVRPRMEPVNRPVMVAFMASGATQLFVGPASRSSTEQMNVRSSTLATSEGSEAHQNELGFFLWSSRRKVPASISRSVMRRHSSWDPSHHRTRSGRVSSATSRIHANSRACRVGAASVPGIAEIVMAVSSWSPLTGYRNRGQPAVVLGISEAYLCIPRSRTCPVVGSLTASTPERAGWASRRLAHRAHVEVGDAQGRHRGAGEVVVPLAGQAALRAPGLAEPAEQVDRTLVPAEVVHR